MRCDSCGHRLTLSVPQSARFSAQPCLRFSCSAGKYALDEQTEAADNYYRTLYPWEEEWSAAALGFAGGMLEVQKPSTTGSISEQQQALRTRRARVPVLLRVADVKTQTPTRLGGIDARQDAVLFSQVPLVSLQRNESGATETTLRLFDDPEARQGLPFEESWRAFLHAWNILQFHPNGVEVVSDEYLALTAAEEGESMTPPRAMAQLRSGSAARPRPPSTAPPPALDRYASFAAEFGDGAHIAELCDQLRDRDLVLPVDAGELELPIELEAILAWPERRVVLVPSPTGQDLLAWQALGWTALDYDAPAGDFLAALRMARTE